MRSMRNRIICKYFHLVIVCKKQKNMRYRIFWLQKPHLNRVPVQYRCLNNKCGLRSRASRYARCKDFLMCRLIFLMCRQPGCLCCTYFKAWSLQSVCLCNLCLQSADLSKSKNPYARVFKIPKNNEAGGWCTPRVVQGARGVIPGWGLGAGSMARGQIFLNQRVDVPKELGYDNELLPGNFLKNYVHF